MSFSRFDHECMALAIRLAGRGSFTTDPNPRVGCVITEDQRVVGQGWHRRSGGPHAEIHALKDAGGEGTTAYVSLEPCSHSGRTAPCADALIEAGIRRVVVAAEDPNPAVGGQGLGRLREAGVAVETGLMAAAAERLNPGFLKRMRTGQPWVRVKTAISQDGRTALENGESQWISNEAARRDVQRWRARSSAILTGIGTVLADDPRLTARVEEDVLQPLRVVADSRWRIPAGCRLLNDGGDSLLAGSIGAPIPRELRGTDTVSLPPGAGQEGVELEALLQVLAEREINEVQVEAGARLCGSLLRAGLVDEVLIYQAPVLLGEGAAAPFLLGPLESMTERTHFEVLETRHFGDNLRIHLRPLTGG